MSEYRVTAELVCTRACWSDTGEEVDRCLKLIIPSLAKRFRRPRYIHVRPYAAAFESVSVPSDISRLGHDHHVAMADLEARARNQAPGGLSAHKLGQLILLRERADHFSGTDRMLVRQDDDTAVPRLRAQSFGNQQHRGIAAGELEGHFENCQSIGSARRQAVQFAKSLFGISGFCFAPRDRIPDRKLVWGQMAHEAQYAKPTAKVPPQIEDQPIAIAKSSHCTVNFARNVQAEQTGKNAHLQVSNGIVEP